MAVSKHDADPVQCPAMRNLRLPLTLFAIAVLVTGCAVDKQWMKVGESYTTAEFRRDYAECSKTKSGELDEDCMRGKGWVEMSPTKADRAANAPPPPAVSPKYQNRSTTTPTVR
jgi:hypothetical protein